MVAALGKVIYFPTVEELPDHQTKLADELFPHLYFFIIDGTTLPTRKPTDRELQREQYVWYKKQVGYRYFVLVTAKGHICFVSNVYFGKAPDETTYKWSGLRGLLEVAYGMDLPALKPYNLVLGGDRGYPNILAPEGWELYITCTGMEDQRADISAATGAPTVIHYNSDFNKVRAVVERSIGRMKHHRLLSLGSIFTCREHVDELKLWVSLAAIFTNLERENSETKCW